MENYEQEQLSKLLKILSKVDSNSDEYLDSYYKIEIAGEAIELYCGGPQLEGLYKLIEHIAAENLYDINYENKIVS